MKFHIGMPTKDSEYGLVSLAPETEAEVIQLTHIYNQIEKLFDIQANIHWKIEVLTLKCYLKSKENTNENT